MLSSSWIFQALDSSIVKKLFSTKARPSWPTPLPRSRRSPTPPGQSTLPHIHSCTSPSPPSSPSLGTRFDKWDKKTLALKEKKKEKYLGNFLKDKGYLYRRDLLHFKHHLQQPFAVALPYAKICQKSPIFVNAGSSARSATDASSTSSPSKTDQPKLRSSWCNIFNLFYQGAVPPLPLQHACGGPGNLRLHHDQYSRSAIRLQRIQEQVR